ncbi:hypothetical protein GWK47_029948 [Chionoecetes opilio]|uniref:Uncharacterized protein n=1 Tax=Chionoecetes opilio TaxID=41210 RepID=A0A8J4YMP5_CHIOP|nr:hypothetical protein GWK47_029948 [Chionoecetes opilio]
MDCVDVTDLDTNPVVWSAGHESAMPLGAPFLGDETKRLSWRGARAIHTRTRTRPTRGPSPVAPCHHAVIVSEEEELPAGEDNHYVRTENRMTCDGNADERQAKLDECEFKENGGKPRGR